MVRNKRRSLPLPKVIIQQTAARQARLKLLFALSRFGEWRLIDLNNTPPRTIPACVYIYVRNDTRPYLAGSDARPDAHSPVYDA